MPTGAGKREISSHRKWTESGGHAYHEQHMKYWFLLVPSLLVSVSAVRATLYFDESFAYAPGEDALTASPLWSSVRNVGSEADVVAGSLSFVDATGRALRTSGGKVLVDTAEEAAEVRHRAPIDLSAHAGPVLWISLLGQQTAGDARRFINLAFMTADNIVEPGDSNSDEDEAFALGVSSSTSPSGWSLYDRALNNGRQISMSPVPTSQASLLLARVEPNVDGGAAERYTFWVNPPLGVAPSEADGLSFVSQDTSGTPASDFNDWTDLIAVRIGAGTASGGAPAASWLVDEIRVGVDWADVLPWSPPLELLPPLPEPGPAGCVITWRPADGRTDVVETSGDLATWIPLEASRRTGQAGETSASFTVPPAPGGSSRYYIRVRREP